MIKTAASGTSTISDKAGSVSDVVTGAPDAAMSRTQGNPLAAGLLAFAAGWLVSSLLPASAAEEQAYLALEDKVKEPVTGIVNEIKDDMQGAAQDAVQSVKESATDAAQAVKDQGAESAQTVRAETQDATDEVRGVSHLCAVARSKSSDTDRRDRAAPRERHAAQAGLIELSDATGGPRREVGGGDCGAVQIALRFVAAELARSLLTLETSTSKW